MPKTSTTGIAQINPLNLAYAVGRLIAAGKTTAAEVTRLAAERADRIKALELELAALKGGNVPAAELAKRAKATRPKKTPAKPAAHANPLAKKKTKSKPVKNAAPAKPGTISTRSNGRTFTTTPKVIAARKWQGQYMGYLRQVPENEKERFRAIGREKGIPAAVAELMKRLGRE